MMEIVNFGGWPNSIRLYNKEIELLITTDVGPRIIRCGYINQQNLLYVSEAEKGLTGGSDWHIYGGHRLWHAPEVMPRTYYPDNFPVGYSWNGTTLKLIQPVEETTGITKEIEITLDNDKNHVHIIHRLINKNLWAIETSPWAITAHPGGSRAILPQEPYVDPADNLLPARPIVLWNYTQMNDRRWTWGNKYIQIQHDSLITSEQKIGIMNKQGWSACLLADTLMIKRFDFKADAIYPDYGSNNEVYVNGQLLEIESLGPLSLILPGKSVEHNEDWYISTVGNKHDIDSESSVDDYILPVINSLTSHLTA
jgi:hypothetical protein